MGERGTVHAVQGYVVRNPSYRRALGVPSNVTLNRRND